MRTKTSILIMTVMIIMSFVGVAGAANYGVAAGNYETNYSAHGTYGYNYVMASPNVSQLHVSSIYVTTSDRDDFAETGWVICPPRKINTSSFFSAWADNGTYSDIIWGDAPDNSNHIYKVQNLIGTDKWRFYVDGTQKLQRTYSSSFRVGTSICSSERNDTQNDTNYSHFWNMRYKNANDNWCDWNDLRGYFDNDPNYYLVKKSNTSCYMQQ